MGKVNPLIRPLFAPTLHHSGSTVNVKFTNKSQSLMFYRYVLNYSPFDITYKLCKFLPFKVVIYCMKEIQRASKVLHGVHFAMKIYPNEWVIISVVGVLKGSLNLWYLRL